LIEEVLAMKRRQRAVAAPNTLTRNHSCPTLHMHDEAGSDEAKTEVNAQVRM